MKKVLPYIFGIIMLLGAIGHIVSPELYAPMVPDFISLTLANVLSVIAEAVIGVALLVPKYRKVGALLFAGLMLAFLPIHIWDMLKENPAIGPAPVPQIRIVVQLMFIYGGWWLYKKHWWCCKKYGG
ncbi:MAG: hypothetical protein AAF740_13700, partial [Bacteroidota bacterium]